MPSTPENGIIENIQSINAVGGAQTVFRCNPGFVPAGRMRATCRSPDGISAVGTWTPDPAYLVCNGEVQQLYRQSYRKHFYFNFIIVNSSCSRSYMYKICVLLVMLSAWSMTLPLISVCWFTASDVVCEDPTPPNGVTVVQPHNITVSSVIFYQCQQSGFAPSPPSSVCLDNGTWSPDFSQVVCTMILTTTLPSSSPAGTVGEYRP